MNLKIITFILSLFVGNSLLSADYTIICEKTKEIWQKSPFDRFIKHIDRSKDINHLYKCTGDPSRPATLLAIVCRNGYQDDDKYKKVQWLVKHGAQITDKTICNILCSLDHDDTKKILKYVLRNGGNANAITHTTDGKAMSALHCLLRYRKNTRISKESLIPILINFGAAVTSNTSQVNHNTVLHYAVSYSTNEHITDFLLNNGAVSTACNDNLQTALHQAACMPCGYDHITVLLRDAQAVALINMQDYKKRTALHCAIEAKHNKNSVALLESPHINLRLQDNEGCAPLYLAKKKQLKTMGIILLRFAIVKNLLHAWSPPTDQIYKPYIQPEIIHTIAHRALKQEGSSLPAKEMHKLLL